MKSQKDMTVGDEPPRSEGVQNVTGEEWRAITSSSRKNEAAETKRKQRSAVDVSGGKSKVWSCKEQYCTGTWNVSSVNRGKLDVVKQGMARVNVDILGISELKWTGMDKCSSDGHYIYYCGQESLRRNGVALIVKKKKSLKCSTWVESQKQHNDLRSFPKKTIEHHSNQSLCPNNWCWS